MDRYFKLKANGTNVRTEIMAGITTFMTMAYILAVNPIILSGGGGLNWTSVFLATALAAGLVTLAMGLFVNFPVALAPGMGLNAYFAAVVSSHSGFTPAMALTAVFISGIIFLILTVTQIRQLLLVAVPDNLKNAITVGIGLFITIIGLKNSGLLTVAISPFHAVKANQYADLSANETIFHMGSITDPTVMLTIIGILIIGILMVLRVRGAILFGILLTTVVAILMGQVHLSALGSKNAMWIPDFGKLNFAGFDFSGVMKTGLLSAVATFTFVELFDTFGTLVGTADRAGILKDPKEGKKRIGKAMLVDAVGVSGGALLGTSTVTAFVESSAGIAEGGRTGLTAVTTGILFLVSLFLSPIAALIPGSATSAALIVVGLLMMQSVKNIDFTDFALGIPAFLAITFMPFTYNISNGISIGIVTYVVLGTAGNFISRGKYKIHWLMWILFVLVILRYIFIGSQG